MTACTHLSIPRVLQNTFLCKVWKSGTTEKFEHSSHHMRYFCSSTGRHFSEWNLSGNDPTFSMQKMKRNWLMGFWNQNFPHSLQVEYIGPIRGLNLRSWIEGKGSDQCPQSWLEVWYTGTGESRCIILGLLWISVFLNNALHHPAAAKLGNSSHSWGGRSCLHFLKRH